MCAGRGYDCFFSTRTTGTGVVRAVAVAMAAAPVALLEYYGQFCGITLGIIRD